MGRRARKQATINMVHVLGKDVVETRAGRKRLRQTVRRMFQYSARNYLESFYLPTVPAKVVTQSMQIKGEEHLKAALAQGKGVLLFSAHVGPFEYLSQWLSINGYPLTIPVEPLKDQRMLNLMLKVRRSHGVEYVPLKGVSTVRSLMQSLRTNKVVLLTSDRAIVGESVEAPFFGAPARLPAGLAALAQRTGAALVGAFGWRTHGTQIEGEFVPLSLALPEEQRANTDILMRGIIETTERVISAHPEQWVVFAPVWIDV
jgi:phosphatidylinositol dimannoside acyltransferase